MLIDNNIKILQGDASLTRIYQGETIVWEPQTETTVIHYNTVNNRIAPLDTSSTWHSSIVSHTYESGVGGTITFNGIQTTFYKLFNRSYDSDIIYLEIPETITHIDDGAFAGLGFSYADRGVKLVALPHTAPTLGNNVWGDAYLAELEYPDDADYLSWYIPDYVEGQRYNPYYHPNSIFNVLPANRQIPPQFIMHDYAYNVYSPSTIVGWDGNYLGDIEVGDYEDSYFYYIFDRKVINVPYGAFENWGRSGYTDCRLVFPDCTKTIENNAFRNARLSMIPRFRGVETLGAYALRTNSFSVVDLPYFVSEIGRNCFPSGTTRINAYGDIRRVDNINLYASNGIFAYNTEYEYYDIQEMIPASWTKQAINMDLWPGLENGAFYVQATGNTLTLDLSLYDSTESWENGIFYISGGTYSNTRIGEITNSEQRKTFTVSVQSGVGYIIYFGTDSEARGFDIDGITGGNILYVNENKIYNIGGGANTTTILITKNGGDLAIYRNNEFRYGY